MHDTIIFDFDGTLIDSAPGILATYAEVLAEANITPAIPLDQSLIGPPLLPTMQKLVGEKSSDPELFTQLVEAFKLRYATTGIAHTPAYPDADRALQALRDQGKTLYLATNKRASPTQALIEKFGWQAHFRRIYCIDSQEPAFADKTAMLRQLLCESRLLPGQCVYVGDTRGDHLSATACGIDFVAALWGYESWASLTNLTQAPIYSHTSLAELADRVARQPPN